MKDCENSNDNRISNSIQLLTKMIFLLDFKTVET